MIERCNPQIVKKAHLQAHSWRKAAQVLNSLYGVNLSHIAWHDYATGKHDITNPETRDRLMLPPRACPSCGHAHAVRKPTKQKRIRKHGYSIGKSKTFIEVIELHHAPR